MQVADPRCLVVCCIVLAAPTWHRLGSHKSTEHCFRRHSISLPIKLFAVIFKSVSAPSIVVDAAVLAQECCCGLRPHPRAQQALAAVTIPYTFNIASLPYPNEKRVLCCGRGQSGASVDSSKPKYSRSRGYVRRGCAL